MTGTRKNKGGHFWHTADYLKERGDTTKQNRGFSRSGPLRPAEAESANKNRKKRINRKLGGSARALLGTHPNGGTQPTNIITRPLMHIHRSRFITFFTNNKAEASSVYSRADRAAARAQIQ